MQLIVHPGIGDISWIISKLSTTGEQFDLIIAEDNKTKRSMPLVDMVPCINSAKYGGLGIYEMLARSGNAKWSEYKEAEKEGKTLYMTANSWLERGNRLEEYLPDLDTDFHYDIKTTDNEKEFAKKNLPNEDIYFGIYTSSSGGIKNWNGWNEFEWIDFILRIHNDFPHIKFVLLGAKWDIDMRVPMLKLLSEKSIDHIDLIGKTSLGCAVEVLKRLNYFAGFAGGLGILSDVLSKPCLMLYPNHLVKLMHAWPSPETLGLGIHTGLEWNRPVHIYNNIRHYLKDYLTITA